MRAKILVVVLFAVLVGCNAMDPAANPVPGPTVIPLSTNVVRTMQVGDWWLYRKQIQTLRGGQTRTFEGTERQFVTEVDDPMFGTLVALNAASNLTATDGTDERIEDVFQWLFRRLPSGRLAQIGAFDSATGETSYVTSPPGGIPPAFDGVLESGKATAIPSEWDDGTVFTRNRLIVGTETVTVPAGSFESFRIEEGSTLCVGSDCARGTFTKWSVPAVGMVEMVWLTSGQTDQATATWELTDTNVPF